MIDVINAFTDPDMMLGANLDDEIAKTNQVLDAAHERGAPVIFTTVMYEDKDFKDAGIWALKQKGVITLKTGTPEAIRVFRRSVKSSFEEAASNTRRWL